MVYSRYIATIKLMLLFTLCHILNILKARQQDSEKKKQHTNQWNKETIMSLTVLVTPKWSNIVEENQVDNDTRL